MYVKYSRTVQPAFEITSRFTNTAEQFTNKQTNTSNAASLYKQAVQLLLCITELHMALPALRPSSITSHNIGRIYNTALHEQSTVTQTVQHNTALHEQSTVTQTLQHNTALHEQSTVTHTLQHNTHFLQTKPITKATVTRPVQLQYKPKLTLSVTYRISPATEMLLAYHSVGYAALNPNPSQQTPSMCPNNTKTQIWKYKHPN